MRYPILLPLLLAPLPLLACTAFVKHDGGRTFIGNNEDSWCIEGRIQFVPGNDGQFGAVYFRSWTGHPFLPWVDQLGMNEAGLVFDGLGIQPKDVALDPGKPVLYFSELARSILAECANVAEAIDLLKRYDMIFLHKSMLFLADAQGRYAVVQNDTIITGQEPHFAVGNWRLGLGTDMDAIPIPRLQQGRELLKAGVAPTVEGAWSVLEGMRSCRKFIDNGTFFSTLFEPDSGRVHLAFYHDYDNRITFDLKEELAKGEHSLDLPALFPPNEAFQRLEAYRTSFHQRWLYWGLMAVAGLAVLLGFLCGVVVLVRMVRSMLGRAARPVWHQLVVGLAMIGLVGLIGVLLVMEQVFYFGLGEIQPALTILPYLLLLATVIMIVAIRKHMADRWCTVPAALLLAPVLIGCAYWGLFW